MESEPVRRRERKIDCALGRVLRRYRQAGGISQEKLARPVGLTFQQVQKYENGTNRLSVSRMIVIAEVLQLDPVVLLQNALDEAAPAGAYHTGAGGNRLTLELAKAFSFIEDQEMRRRVVTLVRALAEAPPPQDEEAAGIDLHADALASWDVPDSE